jgi:hypothetical protein
MSDCMSSRRRETPVVSKRAAWHLARTGFIAPRPYRMIAESCAYAEKVAVEKEGECSSISRAAGPKPYPYSNGRADSTPSLIFLFKTGTRWNVSLPTHSLARCSNQMRLFSPDVGYKCRWSPAARDFGWGQGGEAGASPSRPVGITAEPTQAPGKRPAARRVFAEKAAWLRCSSVEDPPGICSFVACLPAGRRLAIRPFRRKQDSTELSNRLLAIRILPNGFEGGAAAPP